jgi:ribosomal protein L37E
MAKVYRVVRCRRCKMDEFEVHDNWLACVQCGKMYSKPQVDWYFNVSYDTYRTEKERLKD